MWANIWQTDTIVRIDLATGAVTGVVDAAGLLTPEEQSGADVLNGIAKVLASDTFYLTGKLWPTPFEVRFVLLVCGARRRAGAPDEPFVRLPPAAVPVVSSPDPAPAAPSQGLATGMD